MCGAPHGLLWRGADRTHVTIVLVLADSHPASPPRQRLASRLLVVAQPLFDSRTRLVLSDAQPLASSSSPRPSFSPTPQVAPSSPRPTPGLLSPRRPASRLLAFDRPVLEDPPGLLVSSPDGRSLASSPSLKTHLVLLANARPSLVSPRRPPAFRPRRRPDSHFPRRRPPGPSFPPAAARRRPELR